jgi:hypothetical protein
MDKIRIHTIYTYKSHPQEVATVPVDPNISEKNLIRKLTEGMTASERSDLVKISTNQLLNANQNPIGYLLERNGKYYFGEL